MVLKKLILAGLVLLPLVLLVTAEHRVDRRQAICEVIDSGVQPHSLTVPRLRHVVVRLRRALRRRIHHAIHWLRVVRRHSIRFQTR